MRAGVDLEYDIPSCRIHMASVPCESSAIAG